MMFLLDASRGVTPTGTKASTWADIAGTGNTVTQGTDAQRPVILENSDGLGNDALQFSTNQWMTHADDGMMDRLLSNNSWTTFVVALMVDGFTASSQVFWAKQAATTSNFGPMFRAHRSGSFNYRLNGHSNNQGNTVALNSFGNTNLFIDNEDFDAYLPFIGTATYPGSNAFVLTVNGVTQSNTTNATGTGLFAGNDAEFTIGRYPASQALGANLFLVGATLGRLTSENLSLLIARLNNRFQLV
jgi:hypothetical protein